MGRGNSQPLDLQSDWHLYSDTLPTALHGLVVLGLAHEIVVLSTHIWWVLLSDAFGSVNKNGLNVKPPNTVSNSVTQ